MSTSPTHNDKFVKNLIEENINYQFRLRTAQNNNASVNGFEIAVKIMKENIAAKEAEIEDLKQKNMKHLMEIGRYTARNNALIAEKTKLENDIKDISIKYEDIEKKYQEALEQYAELFRKHKQAEDNHLSNFRIFISTHQVYKNENTALKEEVEKQKVMINELQQMIQVQYDTIKGMYQSSSFLYSTF